MNRTLILVCVLLAAGLMTPAAAPREPAGPPAAVYVRCTLLLGTRAGVGAVPPPSASEDATSATWFLARTPPLGPAQAVELREDLADLHKKLGAAFQLGAVDTLSSLGDWMPVGHEMALRSADGKVSLRVTAIAIRADSADYKIVLTADGRTVFDKVVSAVFGQRALFGRQPDPAGPFLFVVIADKPPGAGTPGTALAAARPGGRIQAPSLVSGGEAAAAGGAAPGAKGTVILTGTIGVDGVARNVAVAQALPGCTDLAVRALKQRRYEPARDENGQPLEVQVAASFAFTGSGSAPQPPPPTFKVSAEAVLLDVNVLDSEGHPVRGLTADDFTVLEAGAPQAITAFTAVEVPAGSQAVRQPSWARTVAADVVDNDLPAGGRTIVLVLDDLLPMAPDEGPRARGLATMVVDRLGPSDLVAVAFTSGLVPGVNFTSDHALVRAAIARYRPRMRSEGSGTKSFEAESVSNVVLDIVRGLRDIDKRRKSVLWVSAGLSQALGTVADTRRDISKVGIRPIWADVFDEAARANVAIYPLDPAGLPGRLGLGHQQFAEDVAANTGAFAVERSNDPAPALDRVFAETGTYYMLGYQSSNPPAKKKWRPVSVRVRREGVTVRNRQGYVSGSLTGPAPGANRAPLTVALQSLFPVGDLRLRAAAAPFFSERSERPVVAVTLGVEQTASAFATRDNVEVVVSAYDANGKPAGSVTTRVDVGWPTSSDDGQYELLVPLEVKPGHYTLSIAATTTVEPKTGSVIADIDVPDFAGDRLSLSGVAVSADPPGLAAPRAAFRYFLSAVPTSRRAFSAKDKASATLRVYQGGRDLLAPVSIATAVVDATGAVIVSNRETLAASQFLADRSAEYRVDLPLARLAPGPHLLTIDATLGDRTIQRAVRFDVK